MAVDSVYRTLCKLNSCLLIFYDPQGKFVKPPDGINGHFKLYMASVLPVRELAQGT